ncbi:MAG TPA: hypothetical protein VGH79_05850 [Gaiellaceae bacterium]|jgi:hypothetical protein
MSEMERLEERLRAFGAAPDDGADWSDVRRRSGHARRFPRRRVALAFAACVVIATLLIAFVGVDGGGRGRKAGPAGGLAPPNPLFVTPNFSDGALRSITVNASPDTPSATAELEIWHAAPDASTGVSELVFQLQIPLAAPLGVSGGNQPRWSGMLFPRDWRGGCQGGSYTVDVITPAPGTALSDLLSETPAELSEDPNREIDGATFSCEG